jgi:hypothetical protein
MIAHSKAAKWGNQAGGWVGRRFGPGTIRPNGRGDFDLPPNARMLRFHARVKDVDAGASMSYGHGVGGFAGLLRGDRLVDEFDVLLAADGTFEQTTIGGGITYEALVSVGYWI